MPLASMLRQKQNFGQKYALKIFPSTGGDFSIKIFLSVIRNVCML